MNLKETWQELIKFREDRDWGHFHTDAELARALMVEGAELNRLFMWGENWSKYSVNKEELKDEVADCMIYCMYLCINSGFNPVDIINEKIKKNAQKYPIVKTP